MKTAIYRTGFLVVMLFCLMGGTVLTPRAAAQDGPWRIVRAEYGWRSRQNDVTDLIRDLVSRGGVHGRIAVNNQTMGGDPAVGKNKTLHIVATNRDGRTREFNIAEDSAFDATTFTASIYGDRDAQEPDSGRDNYGNRDRYGARDSYDNRNGDRFDRGTDARAGLEIILGFYGVQGRMANVTGRLQFMVRRGRLTFNVNNGDLGGDPAVGADKVLIVVYRYHGHETATAVPEGGTLSIP